MKKKPVDPIFQTFFTTANIGSSDQKKLLKRLPISISFLQTLGVGLEDVPTEEHMKQLEAHLRALKQEKGRYKGKGYEDTTITDWVNRTRDFFNSRRATAALNPGHFVPASHSPESIEAKPASTGEKNITAHTNAVRAGATPDTIRGAQEAHTNTPKGEPQMTIPETPSTETAGIIPEENSAVTAEPVPAQPQASSSVKASRKPGRPETTGRSEKFTLYMTPELWKKITMLADLDEVSITALMNDALEYYCTHERSEDIAFLYTLERRKQERRLQKARS